MRSLLQRAARRLYRPRHFAVDGFELRGIDGVVAELVEQRMRTGMPTGVLDGERSLRLPHPSKPNHVIKIKGAGFKLGSVQFGTLHRSRLKAPVFDYDGRMMVDVASGHDAAYLGGASFQQASTEFGMAQRLAALGYSVVPCLGYGRLQHKHHSSWFSVHDMRADWESVSPRRISLQLYAEAKTHLGRTLLELAREHGLIGHCWFVAAPDGPLILKDLHPFRSCDPISMSRTSWVMQLFFCLHIASNSVYFVQNPGVAANDVANARIAIFRSIAPNVTRADHVSLSETLVRPYMLGVPRKFDADVLQQILKTNPITRALLDACPEAYERY